MGTERMNKDLVAFKKIVAFVRGQKECVTVIIDRQGASSGDFTPFSNIGIVRESHVT